MGERATRLLRGNFTVGARCADAFDLFTARGERAWAEGWDPIFPAPLEDDSLPGTVFEVLHGEARSTWIVARCERPHLIKYTRTTPGRTAGTITVTCADHGDETSVSVECHLTALTAEGDRELERFSAHYEEFIDGWRSAIARLYAQPR